MAKYKITILDNMSGEAAAEIVESYEFPQVNCPQHTFRNGQYGTPLKVELVVDVPAWNQHEA